MSRLPLVRALPGRRPLVPALALALAMAAGACGGGNSGPPSPTPAAGSPVVVASPAVTVSVASSPTPDPTEAAAAAATAGAGARAAQFQPFTAQDGSFTTVAPAGWEQSVLSDRGTSFAYKDAGAYYANITIGCVYKGIELAPPANAEYAATPEEALQRDAHFVQAYQIGSVDPLSAQPVQSGGRSGLEVRWHGAVSGLVTDNINIYLPGQRCVWNLHLGAYRGLDVETLRELLLRVVDAFQESAG